MEWLTMGVDKPEVGKTYIVFMADGNYRLKRYVKGYVMDHNNITADLSFKPYNWKGETDEAFISTDGWCGRRSNKVLFFLELPMLPKEVLAINKLKAKIAMLEAETRRLKDQLKEETIIKGVDA